MSRKVKTLNDWNSDSFFHDFYAGDLVAEEVVEYFLNVVPPASNKNGYIQNGEPYSHIPDTKGKFKPTYATFKGTETDGVWQFCGCCWLGDTKEPPTKLFGAFHRSSNIGDFVVDSLIQKFREMVEPIETSNESFLQIGITYMDQGIPYHPTFEKDNDGVWIYKGDCIDARLKQ